MFQSESFNTTENYGKPGSNGVLVLPPARFTEWRLAIQELALDKVRPVSGRQALPGAQNAVETAAPSAGGDLTLDFAKSPSRFQQF